MVTTVWSEALVAKGARVAIHTVDGTAAQLAALRSGQVDLVQEYNGDLLAYLDQNTDKVTPADVDASIAAHLPAGLRALRSTPARDDAQLTVSTATAAKFKLHSISDLAAHLTDITLLLPTGESATSFPKELADYYGIRFATTKTTDFAGPKTIAALQSTDSVGLMVASQYQLDDGKLTVLTDPQHLFVVENFVPVIGAGRITGDMAATLDAVSVRLTTAALRGMRKQVASGQGSYASVADAWLASVGLR